MGIALFYLTTIGIALGNGHAFNIATMIIASVIYTQINTMNHTRIDLEGTPWRLINWIAMKHDAHHLGMTKGNYATITLLYDWMFGTLEVHPREEAAKGEGASA